MIYFDNLYNKVLKNPVVNHGTTELSIITGFSSPGMVEHHFLDLKKYSININLIIGFGKIGHRNHRMFKILMENKYPKRFKCYYTNQNTKVHSKLYLWSNNSHHFGFAGSANYSQEAFVRPSQKELMVKLNPESCADAVHYFNMIKKKSNLCTSPDVKDLIKFEKGYKTQPVADLTEKPGYALELSRFKGMRRVRLSLLTKNGNAHKRANGLNWGLRLGRKDRDAAFIPTRDAKKWGFFPSWDKQYFIIQDFHDGDMMFFGVIGGTAGKNLSSSEDNQILGRWFRDKLKIPHGTLITKQHLTDYGKTYADFYKVDDETFLIDF